MRFGIVLLVCLATCRCVNGQGVKVFPYTHEAKLENGSHVLETRIKIYGMGIRFEENPGAGLELNLGKTTVDVKNKRFPVFGKISGFMDEEIIEEQKVELNSIRNEYLTEVKKRTGELISQSNGKISKADGNRLIGELTVIYRNYESKAFDVILPEQFARMAQRGFRAAYRESPAEMMSTSPAREKLNLSEVQLNEVKRIERVYDKKIRDLRRNFKREESERQTDFRQDLHELLSPAQKEKLEELVGRKFQKIW